MKWINKKHVRLYDISDTIPVSSNVSSNIVQNDEDEQVSSGNSVKVAEQNKNGGKISY